MGEIEILQDKIKNLMSDFSEIQNDEINFDSEGEYKLYDIISPHLLSYIFDKILGFKVYYRIFEKINYIINFRYKDAFGFVTHRKLSYILNIDKKYKEEIINIFLKVKELLEKLFFEFSKCALKNDNYMLSNEIEIYQSRLAYFKSQVNKKTVIAEKMKSGEIESKRIIKTKNGTTYHFLIYGVLQEITYNAEAFIDIAYSYIEHIITLLAAFCKYDKPFEKVLHMGWLSKYDLVFGEGQEEIRIKESLQNFKQIYRNRLTHGMFSNEQKLFITIEGLGNYPFYIGKQLNGFQEDKFIGIETFKEFDKLLSEFENLCEKKFKLVKMLIDSGISVHLDIDKYKKALQSKKEMESFIDYISYMQDNQLNMDW
ncbi:MAG: hypothetical protein J1F61_01650 [Clostridiales bacterium]|nr:hypothetical protein [Clostridiales bacterium]